MVAKSSGIDQAVHVSRYSSRIYIKPSDSSKQAKKQAHTWCAFDQNFFRALRNGGSGRKVGLRITDPFSFVASASQNFFIPALSLALSARSPFLEKNYIWTFKNCLQLIHSAYPQSQSSVFPHISKFRKTKQFSNENSDR